jgi:antitoxin ParD1/3/4
MGSIERLTITLPAEMAGLVKGAVNEGDYASTSEVIREALRDWKMKREVRMHRLAESKADLDRGMADVTEGRLTEFDSRQIIAMGKKLSAERAKSASLKKQEPGMDKTIRKYSSFAAVKDDEYREWQALPAHARLDAAAELSLMQFAWKERENVEGKEPARDVQPGLQRTLVRLQRAAR